MVTDWINWQQWTEVGGYDQHHFAYIFQTAFLCVAGVGTVLWTTEAIIIVTKFLLIRRVEKDDAENPPDLEDSEEQEINPEEPVISPENIKEGSDKEEESIHDIEESAAKLEEDMNLQEAKLYEAEKSVEQIEDTEEQETKLDEAGETAVKKCDKRENVREETEEQDKKSTTAAAWVLENTINVSILMRNHVKNKADLDENMKRMKRERCVYRLGILALILTGLLEDLPVILLVFYTAVLPMCGAPARQEVGSDLTMATIVSSMLNSLWTMIILFCELCGCQKICGNIFLRCRVKNHTNDDSLVRKIKSLPNKSICETSRVSRPFKQYCKMVFRSCVKIILLGFIFLLFAGNFSLGLLTIIQIRGSLSLKPLLIGPLFLQSSVPADKQGPGLDGKRDEAMFINIEMKPSSEYQVVLYDDEGYTKARSMWTNQIINRLYIGQLQDLSHIREGTLTKAVPCARVFPFLDRIDETLFTWYSFPAPRNADFSNCKFIFTLRYYPNNNNWNPFKNLLHDFHKDITIEWGIHISDNKVCPAGIRRFSVEEVLTRDVEDGLIKYTCSSSCGDDANICNNAHHAKFQAYWPADLIEVPGGLYFTINDLKVIDSCEFITHFNLSSKFCDEYWADVEPVQVPLEKKHAYTQFITIPELYKFNEEQNTFVPHNNCDQLWNSSLVCCS